MREGVGWKEREVGAEVEVASQDEVEDKGAKQKRSTHQPPFPPIQPRPEEAEKSDALLRSCQHLQGSPSTLDL